MNKIVRSLCAFEKNPQRETIESLKHLREKLKSKGHEVQTLRVVTPSLNPKEAEDFYSDKEVLIGLGEQTKESLKDDWESFLLTDRVSLCLSLKARPTSSDVDWIWRILESNPKKFFQFNYVFNNLPSSPFFPSAHYAEDGVAIGLQVTDLAEDCLSLEDWFKIIKRNWYELVEFMELHSFNGRFLGLDSSIAPLFEGSSSLFYHLDRWYGEFSKNVVSDTFLKITSFIKEENPKPIGLNGLMLPCLEDFHLADEYSKGNFTLERNLFLSLHSGLGVDTYPFGTDEDPEKILKLLQTLYALSSKYKKPLSCRLVSDGRSKIGERSDFRNRYLKDVKLRPF